MDEKIIVPEVLSDNVILSKIYILRKVTVMLDRDLALLYGVETKYLKRQVRRNTIRFPEDFMFELTDKELANWRSQFGTSKKDKMGLRHLPYAFTEEGIAQLRWNMKALGRCPGILVFVFLAIIDVQVQGITGL